MARLSKKQQAFVDEFLIDLNATQAAIRAGYKRSEYTDTNANKLLENTRIAEEIEKKMAERSKRTGINQDRVIEELAKLAFVNPADVINLQSATVLPDAKPEDLACIQSVKVKRTTKGKNVIEEREIRFYDKKDSLVQLGRHLGMFKDKVSLEGVVPTIIDDSGDDDE